MPLNYSLVLASVCFFVLIPGVSAFGAGEIPDFAYLNDKAFRHLDIENILENIVRWKGSNAAAGGILGAAVGFLGSGGGGGEKKFTKADVHRVYFGNWLRDYSQAMDIAGLSKATSQTIILLLSVLSFMTFGYASQEFALLADKLGVYLPVEHIDNPKGYGGNDDPRQFHPKLRPPVDQQELEIDPRTGMKNYIANSGRGWDTSADHVRRSLEKAIRLARQSGGHRSPELYEAYRLMGGALHTLEDLLAHSNWIELSMRKMGARDVFPHVGESVTVRAPNGEQVPPLVTGTFGSADFIFSIMGEATDKLSESSVSELNKKMEGAQGKQDQVSTIKSILSQIPSGSSDTQNDVNKADDMQQKALDFNPDNYVAEDVQQRIWEVLEWRDLIMRKIDTIIEKIPGLEELTGQLTDALNVYIYTTIEPYMKPVLAQVSDALGTGSRAVIDQDDQYEVFNNSNASDPSHSMISKDHFTNILNEPAGKIAKVVDEVAVNKIVRAWSDDSVDIGQTIDEILQALHHPYFANERSEIQMAMAQMSEKWYSELGRDRDETLRRLTKQSVQDGGNRRLGSDDSVPMHSHDIGRGGHGHGGASTGGYGQSGRQQQHSQSGYGGGRQQQQQQQTGYGGGRQQQQTEYGGDRQQQTEYGGGRQQQTEYGGGRQQQTEYGGGRQQQTDYGGGRQQQTEYGGGRQQQQTEYGGGRQQQTEYGGGGYGGRQEESTGYRLGQAEESYGGGGYTRQEESYTGGGRRQGREEESTEYGRHTSRRQEESESTGYSGGGAYGQQSAYGSERRREENSGYQQSRRDEDTSGGYGASYGGRQQQTEESYGRSERTEEYGSGRRHEERSRDEYGGSREESYGGGGHHNRRHQEEQEESYGGRGGGRRTEETEGYSEQFGRMNIRGEDEDEGKYHGKKHHHQYEEGGY